MNWIELATAVAAFCALLLGGGSLYLAIRAIRLHSEPVELRKLVIEYDQALGDHQQRCNAWYARTAKLLQSYQAPEAPQTDEGHAGGGGTRPRGRSAV